MEPNGYNEPQHDPPPPKKKKKKKKTRWKGYCRIAKQFQTFNAKVNLNVDGGHIRG